MSLLACNETSTVDVTRVSSHQVDKGHSLHMLTETQRASEGPLHSSFTLADCQRPPGDQKVKWLEKQDHAIYLKIIILKGKEAKSGQSGLC